MEMHRKGRGWKRVLSLFKNFYFVVALMVGVWILFIDSNDLFTQIKLERQLLDLKKQKKHYEEKIQETKAAHTRLYTDTLLIERIAREKYKMKKPSEDIYVIQKRGD